MRGRRRRSAGELEQVQLARSGGIRGAARRLRPPVAGRPRHAVGAIHQHQHARLAARVEPRDAEQRQRQRGERRHSAEPARPGSWCARRSRGFCARVARSIGTTGRPSAISFPQQHEQTRDQKTVACQSRSERAVASRRARGRLAPVRADGATLAEPAPRSDRSRSRRASGLSRIRSNIKFTSSGISGPRSDLLRVRNPAMSREVVDAPARLTIRGSSPTASRTTSAGPRCEPRCNLHSLGSSLMRRDSGTADDHCSAPRGRDGSAIREHTDRRNAAAAPRVPQSSAASTSGLLPSLTSTGRGARQLRPGALADTSHRSRPDAGAAGRGRARSRRLRQAHRRAAVRREPSPMPESTRSRASNAPASQAEIGPGDSPASVAMKTTRVSSRGPAVRDLEQHVVPFRVVQASARRQSLQPDIARDAAHLDDAIGAALAGPFEQRGMRTVRQQPMQAVVSAAAPRAARSAASVRRRRAMVATVRIGQRAEHGATGHRACAPRHRHAGPRPAASALAPIPRRAACRARRASAC